MANAQSYMAGIELLADEKSSTKRRELLHAVTDIFIVTQDDQNDADCQLFGDVMERIAFELQIEARAQLSQRICDLARAPHKLIVRLANDDISVAGPVLERSDVLGDTDLVDVIRNRSHEHMHSIAGRQAVSQTVSGELVDHGNDRTLTRLTGNRGAEISSKSFEKIVDRAHESQGLRDALGARSDVPAEVMEGIKGTVTGRVKSELLGSHPNLDEKFVGALVERCAGGMNLDICNESMAQLNHLHRSGGLQEDLVARLAREKKLPDTVHCLSLVTGLENWAVSQILLKAELPALAILCKSCDFRGSTFLAMAETRIGNGKLQASALAKAMRDYNTLNRPTADRIMRYLKVRLKLNGERAADG